MIKWIKEGGVEVETNDEPANVAKATSLGWERVGEVDPEGGEVSVDEMKAAQLKKLCKELDIEYEGKDEAVAAIKAKQAESGEE